MCKFLKQTCIYKHFMRVLITNGYIVYYFNVVPFKTEIYDDDDEVIPNTKAWANANANTSEAQNRKQIQKCLQTKTQL